MKLLLFLGASLLIQQEPRRPQTGTNFLVIYTDYERGFSLAMNSEGHVRLQEGDMKVHDADSLQALPPEAIAKYDLDTLDAAKLQEQIGVHREGVLELFRPTRPQTSVPGMLGVLIAPVTSAMRSQLQLPQDEGLLLIDVKTDSLAMKSGLQEYDVVTRFDDQPVASFKAFIEFLRPALSDQKEFSLDVVRQGRKMKIAVKP